MPWLCFLLLSCCVQGYLEPPFAQTPCNRYQFIEWPVGVVQQTRSVNLSMCGYGSDRIEILRPHNSCKHIRATIISQDVTDVSSVKIIVIERGMAMDKSGRNFNRKNMRGVNATVIASPFTHLKLNVIKSGVPSLAELTFQFSVEEDGCPYPFLDIQSGIPIEISSKVLAYECDFTVTAYGPGEVLAFSLSPPLFLMRIYEDYYFDPAMSTNFIPIDDQNIKLKTSRALIHLSNIMNRSVIDHEERIMIIKTAIDDCSCDKSVITLDNPSITYSFKLEKLHCYHVTCRKRVQIEEPLRDNYRLHVWPIHRRGDGETRFTIIDGNNYLDFEFTAIEVFINATGHHFVADELKMITRHENEVVSVRDLTNTDRYVLFSPGSKGTEVMIHYHRIYSPRLNIIPGGGLLRRPEYYGQISLFIVSNDGVTEK